jgi:hypothetical protein
MRAPAWRRLRRQGPHQLFKKHAPHVCLDACAVP